MTDWHAPIEGGTVSRAGEIEITPAALYIESVAVS